MHRLTALFSRHISLRVISLIVLIEIVMLSLLGRMATQLFNQEIDRRIQERVEIPQALFATGALSLAELADPQVVAALIDESVVDNFFVDNNGQIFLYALNRERLGTPVSQWQDIDLSLLDLSVGQTRLEHVAIDDQHYIDITTPIYSAQDTRMARYYVRISTTAAEASKSAFARNFVVGALVTMFATSMAIYFMIDASILRRVLRLKDFASRVQGDDTEDVSLLDDGHDEIAALSESLKAMSERIDTFVNGLEQLVANRTRDLQLTIEIARQISSELQLESLSRTLLQLTKERFQLYAVSFFLLDHETDTLKRIATVGPDQATVHGSELGDVARNEVPSAIAHAARHQQIVTIDDTRISSVFQPQPLLPDTRSELVVPVIFSDEVIGIFDAQSTQIGRFHDNDIRLLKALSEQFAIAVTNARLFEAVQQARKDAEQMDQSRAEFLASMSHEMRTSLNSIKSFAQFLLNAHELAAAPSTEQRMLTSIAASASHLLALTEDVLDMSSIEARSFHLWITDDVDVQEIIQHAVTSTAPIRGEKPIEVTIDIPADLPRITGDPRRLLQIMLNILSNASRVTLAGAITIAVTMRGRWLHIAVTDTGPGIEEQYWDIVFAPFKQITENNGSGLGLYITRKLVEAHGGRIWFTSTTGTGTTFFVEIRAKE